MIVWCPCRLRVLILGLSFLKNEYFWGKFLDFKERKDPLLAILLHYFEFGCFIKWYCCFLFGWRYHRQNFIGPYFGVFWCRLWGGGSFCRFQGLHPVNFEPNFELFDSFLEWNWWFLRSLSLLLLSRLDFGLCWCFLYEFDWSFGLIGLLLVLGLCFVVCYSYLGKFVRISLGLGLLLVCLYLCCFLWLDCSCIWNLIGKGRGRLRCPWLCCDWFGRLLLLCFETLLGLNRLCLNRRSFVWWLCLLIVCCLLIVLVYRRYLVGRYCFLFLCLLGICRLICRCGHRRRSCGLCCTLIWLILEWFGMMTLFWNLRLIRRCFFIGKDFLLLLILRWKFRSLRLSFERYFQLCLGYLGEFVRRFKRRRRRQRKWLRFLWRLSFIRLCFYSDFLFLALLRIVLRGFLRSIDSVFLKDLYLVLIVLLR